MYARVFDDVRPKIICFTCVFWLIFDFFHDYQGEHGLKGNVKLFFGCGVRFFSKKKIPAMSCGHTDSSFRIFYTLSGDILYTTTIILLSVFFTPRQRAPSKAPAPKWFFRLLTGIFFRFVYTSALFFSFLDKPRFFYTTLFFLLHICNAWVNVFVICHIYIY